MSNLLSNAVRLAPEGTPITVAAGSRQGWAWVAVRDEGPGIADEDRDRIFERFHRGSGQLSQGSGLGLTIARQIAESHQPTNTNHSTVITQPGLPRCDATMTGRVDSLIQHSVEARDESDLLTHTT